MRAEVRPSAGTDAPREDESVWRLRERRAAQARLLAVSVPQPFPCRTAVPLGFAPGQASAHPLPRVRRTVSTPSVAWPPAHAHGRASTHVPCLWPSLPPALGVAGPRSSGPRRRVAQLSALLLPQHQQEVSRETHPHAWSARQEFPLRSLWKELLPQVSHQSIFHC